MNSAVVELWVSRKQLRDDFLKAGWILLGLPVIGGMAVTGLTASWDLTPQALAWACAAATPVVFVWGCRMVTRPIVVVRPGRIRWRRIGESRAGSLSREGVRDVNVGSVGGVIWLQLDTELGDQIRIPVETDRSAGELQDEIQALLFFPE